MRKQFILRDFLPELKVLASNSPRTEKLQTLIKAAEYRQFVDENDSSLRSYSRTPVVASTDRWSELMYQSLYIRDGDPDNRIVLQEPATPEPSVCITVLKAARLSGDSGIVYCGTSEQLQAFKNRLPEYEELGQDLNEKDFVECLIEAAQKEFHLKVIYQQLSLEHGGEEYSEED